MRAPLEFALKSRMKMSIFHPSTITKVLFSTYTYKTGHDAKGHSIIETRQI